ncbi:hypothetical protein RM533_09180 [Croceicoccus sp. F390]|uniref:Uncharacterized protein n=1 Tax=Croceicoccus esteveae TaxID=3075597 RepID=A0ABU2ZIZ3_9SPHN|nr:hypothetical protein [Croceicoccus sp. F390]MDT0576360.1 hypothetical protein [Croceicoccus sp. F390]
MGAETGKTSFMSANAGPSGRFFQIGYVTRNIANGLAVLEIEMGAQRIDLLDDLRDAQGNQLMIRALSHLNLEQAKSN